MAAEAKFYLRMNWRGKLAVAVLKFAIALVRIGFHKTAERVVRRVMTHLECRHDWFDVSSKPRL